MGRLPLLQQGSKLRALLTSNQDALVCLFDQGVVSVAGFATNVLIGRFAGKSELGVYFIGLTMVLFARGFQQQLVSTPYTIFHHRQESSNLPAYRGSCLVQQAWFLIITLLYLLIQIAVAASGLIVLSLVYLSGESFADWSQWISLDSKSIQIIPTLTVLAAFIPVVLMREIVRHYCFTHSENIDVLGFDTVVSVLQILSLFALGYLGLLSGASAWLAISFACLVAIVFWYLRSGPPIQFSRQRLDEDLKLNWSFGKWAVSGQFVGSLPTYLLPWLLLIATGTKDAGAEGNGLLAACMTLVGVANIFNTGMLNFLTPKAARVYVEEGNAGLKRVLIRMYGLFFVVVGGFAVFLTFFGGTVAVKLFGSDYAGLEITLILLAVAKLFDGFSHTASGGLFAMEKIKANFGVDVILMLVTITSAVLLIPNYGLVGVAWTTLIGSVTGAVLRSALLMKFLGSASTAGESNV